ARQRPRPELRVRPLRLRRDSLDLFHGAGGGELSRRAAGAARGSAAFHAAALERLLPLCHLCPDRRLLPSRARILTGGAAARPGSMAALPPQRVGADG